MANARPPARKSSDPRTTWILVLVVLALLVAIGALVVVLTRDNGEPTPTAEPTTPAETVEPSVEPTTEPPTTTEPPATTEPEPPAILLTGEGVGSVALDTPNAQAALEALFGPATRTEPGNDECGGPGDLSYLWWGDLKVTLSAGALYGWGVRGNALPADVAVEHGVGIGDPYADVAALPGAAPEYMENFGRIVTPVDGISYWSTEGSDVAAVTVFDITVRPVVCG